MENNLSRSKKNKKKYRNSKLGYLLWIPIVGLIAGLMYSMNNYDIYNTGEYRSQKAVSDYIAQETNVDYIENEPILVDKSFNRVEPDLIREANFGAKSAIEITYVFEYEDSQYKVVSIVENIEDGSNFANWEFYKVESIEKLK